MSDSPFHEHRFRAMGSQVVLLLEHDDGAFARARLAGAQARIEAAEQILSRFRPDSELSRLNGAAGDWAPVGALLWRLLARALELAAETDGLFDPTMLNATLASGYTEGYSEGWREGREAAPPTPAPLRDQWRAVELDAERRAVRLPAGVRVDLGGIAKGAVAQEIVHWLGAWGPALVDAGGDVTAGEAPRGHEGWPLRIAPPEGVVGSDAPHFALCHATAATSGTDYRWWRVGDERRSHLMDPRTGRPAQSDLLTVTVIAAEAARAEAWATAALVAGRDRALHLLDAQGLDAALFDHAGRATLTAGMRRRTRG